MYIYLPSVIPYTPVFYFNDMQYFFRYAHAHTTSQARERSEHFNVELEKEGKLCDIERLKRKKDWENAETNTMQKFQKESCRDSD